jgi:hypothetical protein
VLESYLLFYIFLAGGNKNLQKSKQATTFGRKKLLKTNDLRFFFPEAKSLCNIAVGMGKRRQEYKMEKITPGKEKKKLI